MPGPGLHPPRAEDEGDVGGDAEGGAGVGRYEHGGVDGVGLGVDDGEGPEGLGGEGQGGALGGGVAGCPEEVEEGVEVGEGVGRGDGEGEGGVRGVEGEG